MRLIKQAQVDTIGRQLAEMCIRHLCRPSREFFICEVVEVHDGRRHWKWLTDLTSDDRLICILQALREYETLCKEQSARRGQCPNCGERLAGDGYTLVRHCPSIDLDGDEEPDSPSKYCEVVE